MAIITRPDGTHFVLHCYRETIYMTHRTLLANEIRHLALSNGQYVLLNSAEIGGVDAVFSREPGYLLADSVWHYFAKPDNLIYCEAIDEGFDVLLIVIRDGKVHLDVQIPAGQLHDELANVLALGKRFDIKVYGNVALDEAYFPETMDYSFNVLTESVFAHLPLLPEYRLKHVEQALKDSKLGRRGYAAKSALYLASLIILVAFAWPWLQLPPAPVANDPWQDFYREMAQANVMQKMAVLTDDWLVLHQLPGWVVRNASVLPGLSRYRVSSIGGSAQALLNFARQHRFQVELTPAGILLVKPHPPLRRPGTYRLFASQPVIAAIIDSMRQIVPQKTVFIGSITRYANYTSTKLTLNVRDLDISVLDLLGKAMVQLPVFCSSMQFTNHDGRMSGTIALQVIGS